MKNKHLKSKTFRSLPLVAVILLSISQVFAQVKVGDNPTTIAAGSALEIESGTKGLRLPQVSLTSTIVFAPIAGSGTATTSPGMQVHNTNAGITAGNGTNGKLYPAAGIGVYYWDGFGWVSQNPQTFKGYRVVWAGKSPGPVYYYNNGPEDQIAATETFDSYNAGSGGTYTAPVSGYYTSTQSFTNGFWNGGGYSGSFTSYINVTPVGGTIEQRSQFNYGGPTGYQIPFSHALTVYLNAGDKITYSVIPCLGCTAGLWYNVQNIVQTISLFEQ
ncbi:hypothetical protein [Dyadobacter diqingensis]|uniref:hypothetical protein n=1 Tax=Dyadobacter diqingensis TaxID=2938121 RepID=UPI0020C19A2A|nr:hypothetical protein [Dyadobacter diqingensis]